MSTSSASIGVAVRDSWRFLRSIYNDTLAFVQAVDAEMAKNEWYPTEANRISDDLYNGSSAGRWLLGSIYRIYVNSTATGSADRVLAFHILFDPPALYDQPVCLCIAATFEQPVDTAEVWNKWAYGGSERALCDLRGMRDAKTNEVKAIMPQARQGSAFFVPLCAMSDPQAVREEVVRPLMGMLEGK